MAFEKRVWNRNCAFSPEEVAFLNEKSTDIVRTALGRFDEVTVGLTLSEVQRKEAFKVFAAGISDGLADTVESVQKASAIRTDF
jgi:hypothetical protein